MWAAFFFALLVFTAATFFYVYRQQRRMIDALHRAREKIQLEETRVFDFLHGLGAALSDTSRPTDLHVLIVEGALRILEASGGALYLSDSNSTQLRPAFVSRSCPPFFEVPPGTAAQPGFSWQSYLRLRGVVSGEGIIGQVAKSKMPLLLRGDDARLEMLRVASPKVSSAMLSPLIYGDQELGVLAIARAEGSEPFLTAEFQIFKTIAEQSAFALYNAIIFSQAAEKKRLDEDLQVAHEIQRILLPANSPELGGFQ
ncbi:MAG TPA: GAF domain-containing protein, partial [Chthoniobacteraceae bacterium]|nr:GAF domain-containing protein [Chthoniobacteraceae bacterium]